MFHSPTAIEPYVMTARTYRVGDLDLVVLEMGRGKPLLVLHEELGCPGPLLWQADLSKSRKLVVPLHTGFGRTRRLDWVSSVRDLACFYARFLREQALPPIDVVGFSFGGWVAAEMAANDPALSWAQPGMVRSHEGRKTRTGVFQF